MLVPNKLAVRASIMPQEDICAENNADFLHYEVVPLPHADRPDF
jgi:hypothetical protein